MPALSFATRAASNSPMFISRMSQAGDRRRPLEGQRFFSSPAQCAVLRRRRCFALPQNSSDCRTPATVQTNAPLSDSHHNLHGKLGVSLTCGGVATTTAGEFRSDELYSRDEIRSTFDFHAAAGGAPYNAINGRRWASDRQRAVCKASSKRHLRKAPSESQCTVVSW